MSSQPERLPRQPPPGTRGQPLPDDSAHAPPVAAGEPVGVLAPYELSVNGTVRRVVGAWVGESLLTVLRDRLGLVGTKGACEQGECGSCSVLLDGSVVCSCCVLAADAVGAEVTTIEGLTPPDGLSDIQQALVAAGGVQCGFCTPGFVVAIHDLLSTRPDATELEVREALSGNLCRCTGYGRIVEAVRIVQREREAVGG